MPAGRILLKSISESKKLSELKTDGARLLYTWMIAHLDINGCFSGDAKVIRGKIFTRLKKSDKTTESYLQDLERMKLILRYEVNGDMFLHSPDFTKKQPTLNPKREGKPVIPMPSQDLLRTYSGLTPTQVKESKGKESKESRNKEFATCDIELTDLLIKGMQSNDYKAKVPKKDSPEYEKWVNQIRLCRESDGRTEREIESMILFSQTDDFWSGNILSAAKLRKQIPQLLLKSKKRIDPKASQVGSNPKQSPKEKIISDEYVKARLEKEQQLKEKHGYKEIEKRARKSGDLTELEDMQKQVREELAEFTREYYAKEEKSGGGNVPGMTR